jgi:alpha-tubulin suppressor-like RCC1 family protein
VVNGLSFTAITNGELHFCGLVPGGQAYCWGDNGVGQLGTGDFAYSDVPVPVQGGLTFTTLDAGRFHTCALTNTAVVYCWGGNGVGQLGNGTRTNSPVPVRVAGQP